MSVEAVGGFAPAEAAGDLVEGGGAPGEGLLHPYFRGGGEVEGAGDSVIVGGFGGKELDLGFGDGGGGEQRGLDFKVPPGIEEGADGAMHG